jgi:hypothetical protein
MNTAGTLLELARYYRNHPDAWLQNGFGPGALLPAEERPAVIAALRAEIGAPGEFGALTVWCQGKTLMQIVRLLERTAKKLLAKEAA